MSRSIDTRTRQRSAPAHRAGVFTAFGLAAEAEPLAPGLYVVATPIGNLKDVSFRGLGVLAAADAVLAEDTRVTKTLLAHYGITTPLVAYHEHSNAAVRERMIHRLKDGQALALVSDAGTPLVSDPGYKLVQAAIAEGVPVTPIPGPSAILTALVVSGLPTDRFFFEGFLPPKSAARRTRLAELAGIPGTLMLFEAPHRLPEMLGDAAAVLGGRQAVVARELTKLFETVRRGTLAELAAQFAAEGPPKGEIVVADRRGERTAPRGSRRGARREAARGPAAPFHQGRGRPRRRRDRPSQARGLCTSLDARQGAAMRSALERRRATYLRGHWAERVALALLVFKGYRLLARRYAASGGEIDLIVKRGDTVAFVEVKARGLLDDALGAIGAQKRQRFSRAARAWVTRNTWAAGKTFRADAVFVAPRRWPRHLVAAFELDF